MDTRPDLMPKARKDRLIIKELPDETLVYDLDTDKAHCLNETASIVWKNCDGRKTVFEITECLGKAHATLPPQNVVWLALEQLESFKLLDQTLKPSPFGGMDRRKVLRTLGATAIGLPVIVSIIAPIAAEAQSGCTGGNRPTGCPCSNNNQCQSNNCAGTTCA